MTCHHPIWGYNGIWPGPTMEVRSGVPVKIKYHNDALPTTHPLPVDFTIHGSEADKPQVRNVVHLHGAKYCLKAMAIRKHGFLRTA